MMFRRSSLISLLSLITAARGQLDIIFPTSRSDFSTDLRIPFDIWNNALSSANATGFSRIKGKNTTLPYDPAASSTDDWTYTIQIRDDVATSNGQGFISGTWIKVEAPQNVLRPSPVNNSILTVPMHSSWNVCGLVWAGPNLRSDTPISGPGCTGFLADGCINDLRRHLEELARGICPAPRLDFPESCSGAVWINGTGVNMGIQTELPDPSQYPGYTLAPFQQRLPFGTYDFIKFGVPDIGSRHQSGNSTAYEEALKRVYVVGHIWGFLGSLGRDNNTAVSAEITCLQANNVLRPQDDKNEGRDEEGSNENGSQGTGNGGPGGENSGGSCLKSTNTFLFLTALVVMLFSSC